MYFLWCRTIWSFFYCRANIKNYFIKKALQRHRWNVLLKWTKRCGGEMFYCSELRDAVFECAVWQKPVHVPPPNPIKLLWRSTPCDGFGGAWTKKKRNWKLSTDLQPPKQGRNVWPFCSFALWWPVQPISCQKMDEWPADLAENLIYMISPWVGFSWCHRALVVLCMIRLINMARAKENQDDGTVMWGQLYVCYCIFVLIYWLISWRPLFSLDAYCGVPIIFMFRHDTFEKN